jgi:hypothetical protein
MVGRLRRNCLAVLLAVGGLLSYQVGEVGAHPQLVGRWVSPTPPGGLQAYEFGPGEYIGNGCWRGPYTYFVAGCGAASWGEYELMFYTGSEATLALRDRTSGPGWNVGNVDFSGPQFIFINATFKR